MAVIDVITQRARQTRAFAVERWSVFRAESPYFQGKVGLVTLYLLVVALTLALAPPAGAPWVAKQERIPFGLTFKTAMEITSVDAGDFTEAILEVRGQGIEFDGKRVPGAWRSKPLTLLEGLPTKVLTEQLFNDKGGTAPYSLVIETVTVLDDDRDVVVVLRPAPPVSP